jgi:hypothetical protein
MTLVIRSWGKPLNVSRFRFDDPVLPLNSSMVIGNVEAIEAVGVEVGTTSTSPSNVFEDQFSISNSEKSEFPIVTGVPTLTLP